MKQAGFPLVWTRLKHDYHCVRRVSNTILVSSLPSIQCGSHVEKKENSPDVVLGQLQYEMPGCMCCRFDPF